METRGLETRASRTEVDRVRGQLTQAEATITSLRDELEKLKKGGARDLSNNQQLADQIRELTARVVAQRSKINDVEKERDLVSSQLKSAKAAMIV